MIELRYVKNYIVMSSNNEIDLIKDIVSKNDKFIYNKNDGSWYISELEISWINTYLKKYADKLHIHDSLKDFGKEYRKNLDRNNLMIKVGPTFTRMYDMTRKIDIPEDEIQKATRFFFKGANHSKSFQDKKWDGYLQLYDKRTKKFPSGLLDIVISVLKRNKIKYSIQYMYNRNPLPMYNWEVCNGLIPDEDQVDAIHAAIENKRGILKAPTGFGKTAILAINIIAALGVPTLFLANKKSLLDDAQTEFLDGISGLDKVSQIKDGFFGDTKLPSDDIKSLDAPVIVGTVQSLHARLKDPKTGRILLEWLNNTCKLVIVDECQALGTKTWDYVLDRCKAPCRIGLSATPKRTDGSTIKLMGSTGPVLFNTTAEKQIAKGRLCEITIKFNKYDHGLYNQNDSNLIYNEVYKECIVNNIDRNLKMVVRPALEMVNEGRFVLILIQYIEHGTLIKQLLLESGLDLEDIRFIWGDTKDSIRKEAISEFRKGAFKVMIGSTIFDAGVNIPIISGVILAGAGNSEITLVQRIGRGARNCDYEDILGYLPEFMKKHHGKKYTLVYDILDTNIKFFHKQAINRYYNARYEFGYQRVHIENRSDLAISSKSRKASPIKHIDSTAKNKVLSEFSDNKNKKKLTETPLSESIKYLLDNF